MFCVAEELLRLYVQSVQDVLSDEMEFFATISPEEWLLLKVFICFCPSLVTHITTWFYNRNIHDILRYITFASKSKVLLETK